MSLSSAEQLMNHLMTQVKVSTFPHPIKYQDHIMMIGSCFAQRIQGYLNHYLYHTSNSPFGITYNPYSIGQGLIDLVNQNNYDFEQLFYYRERWHSPSHHGKYSHDSRAMCIANIQKEWSYVKDKLAHTKILIITLGTAWVYHDQKSQYIVNNCHQRPATDFIRYRLSITEVVEILHKAYQAIYQINPQIKIIYTVSPVRHLKDGAIENQRSKSTLLLAIEKLLRLQPTDCFYFPAYEIMLDELRDYRFYKDDLLHPNDMAVRIICDIFTRSYLDPNQIKIRSTVSKLQKSLSHKAHNPNSDASIKHKNKVKHKLSVLKQEYPYLNYDLIIS
jgi:hypothetical protein